MSDNPDFGTFGRFNETPAEQMPADMKDAYNFTMKLRGGVIVNVTSSLGSFWAVTNPDRHESQAAFVVYGATKAAVSMLTVQYAKALPGIKVNAVEPGYTATDLTRNGGGQQPSDGAEVIAAAATIGKDGPTGTLQERDGVLAW